MAISRVVTNQNEIKNKLKKLFAIEMIVMTVSVHLHEMGDCYAVMEKPLIPYVFIFWAILKFYVSSNGGEFNCNSIPLLHIISMYKLSVSSITIRFYNSITWLIWLIEAIEDVIVSLLRM